MRIVFDPDFDLGSWPGPLGADPAKAAVIGEAWVGPLGLRDLLENALGLRGHYPSSAERTAALAKTIREVEGFWSASASKDAFGSGRVLLRWIDWLGMHGWNGGSSTTGKKPSRIRDLACLRPRVHPGGADRLAAILAALDKRKADFESLETHEPLDRLTPLWRTIFSKLRAQGVLIREAAAPAVSAKAGSDLAASLRPEFRPSGDGSLVLYRPSNFLDAAEGLAVRLSAIDDLAGVVVISPGVVLDEALQRFGLPVAGARDHGGDDPFLQILPLVLAMGWYPPDPQRALELLLIPDGPVHGGVARRLRDALQEWPAVGSPTWEENLNKGLEKIEDAGFREKVAARLAAFFKTDAGVGNKFPRAAIKERTAAVKKWALGRRHIEPPPHDDLAARLDAVIAQCGLFESLLDLAGFESLTEPRLLRLSAEATAEAASSRRYAQQAGIAVVDRPGALAGPARHVVWWDFSMEAAPEPIVLPLSRDELAELESAGVRLTTAIAQAADLARRWRRPFLRASETLVLVCPEFGEDNEPRHHHPLWDEVTAGRAKDGDLGRVEKRTLDPRRPVKTRTDTFLPVPAAKRSWAVAPEIVTLPARHSPTGMGDLIGCPFKWTLKYLGKLRDPESAALAESGTLTGSLAHEILALVLREKPKTGKGARAKALELFGTLGPRLAAPLFRPGAPFQADIAQNATGESAADLVEILRKAGLQPTDVEEWFEAATDRLELRGRIDLVAGAPPVIIDLKWGGETYRRDQFKSGTALQLAAYSRMVGKDGEFPPVAFYIISTRRLIAPKGTPFKGADAVEGPGMSETWLAVEASVLAKLGEIKAGRVEALANPIDPQDPKSGVGQKDALEEGRIVLSPPCKFCSFGYLCGLAWEASR